MATGLGISHLNGTVLDATTSTSSTPHPTTTWEPMSDGTTFYSKHQLYMMHWSASLMADLSEYIIVPARYGGPIALMRDPTKLAILRGGSATILGKNQVIVWSPVGEQLLSINWDTKFIGMGWTGPSSTSNGDSNGNGGEQLVILNEEGAYRLYSLADGSYVQHSLGSEASEVGVVECKIYEDGLVALLAPVGGTEGELTFLELRGWDGSKPWSLASASITQPPAAWTLIPPSSSQTSHLQLLVSPFTSSTILTIDSLSATDQRLSRGPFSHIRPSPSGRYLALMTPTGALWVVSSDFSSEILEWMVEIQEGDGGVRQVEWCGNDAVVLATHGGETILVGPGGDTLRFPSSSTALTPSPTILVPEPDSIRLLSPTDHSLLIKVHPSSLAIFKPGSTHESATLFDAWTLFIEKKAATKVEYSLRLIRQSGSMASAVDGCIQAAGREWEPYWQRRLLSAAKFGRSFLSLPDPTDFINMGQALRVLNGVRYYEVGIPITYAQYTLHPTSTLVKRLTSRKLHLLAFRVSSYLGLKPDIVLKDWAMARLSNIKSSPDKDINQLDDDTCNEIVSKFEQFGGRGLGYSEVAKKAWEVGRRGLATKLLDHEPRAAAQVPLLLQMKEDRLALLKAVSSGDTDLVYTSLLTLNARLALGNFFALLESSPHLKPAKKLFELYARSQNREMLRDFYYSDDRRVESAVLALEEAKDMIDPTARITSVKSAQKFFGEEKDRAFEAKMTEDHARLLSLQQTFEREDPSVTLIGLSVDETLRTCIISNMTKRVEKVRSDFKVPDKRFWYLKLHTLTSMKDFIALETFARSKKSPIGYEPFVHHLVEKGHPKEATSFVQRCDVKKRIDLYVECGDWKAAGKECKERGDRARLEQLRKTCPNTLMQRELDHIASTMGK